MRATSENVNRSSTKLGQRLGLSEFFSYPQGRGARTASCPPGAIRVSTMLSAREANERFGVAGANGVGALKFDGDVPEDVAQFLSDAKHDELFRADAAARAAPGFWNRAARLGANFAAGALDPLNLAASFVPVLGEERTAALMASAGESALARTGMRAAIGAARGVAGQAALEPLLYAEARSRNDDFTATQALSDLAFGGVLGGGLHVAIGGAGDALGRLFRDSAAGKLASADIDTRAAMLNTAVAQEATGRPVEVGPVVDAARTRLNALDP